MNNNYNPKKMQIKTWAFWITISILVALLLSTMAGDYFKNMFMGFLTALTPILFGLILAFILKKLVDLLENKVFKNLFKKSKNSQKIKRYLSLTIIFIVLVAILVLLISLIIPNIVEFIRDFAANSAGYIDNLANELETFFSQMSIFQDVDMRQWITENIDKLVESLTTNIPIITSTILNTVSQTLQILLYILIGFIIAFLILKDKEKISKTAKRLAYANLKTKKADYLVDVAVKSDEILYSYCVSKILESVVIFALILPGFYIIGVPYALGMSALLAIFNIIPYAGSIFAMIPITILCIIFADVSTALWALLYLNIILTLVGNFVSPIIYSKKLKVNALLMISSILIGGGLFGLGGMLLAPPLVAVLTNLLRELTEKREKEKERLKQLGIKEEYVTDVEVLHEAIKIVEERRLKDLEIQTQNLMERKLELEKSIKELEIKKEKKKRG